MVIGWWSAGVTSAVAIKLSIDRGEDVYPIYFETGSHHSDNERFRRDCEAWYGRPILVMKNPKYENVIDVIKRERYVNGPGGAKCTAVLKKELRFVVEKWFPYDAQIFGFEYDPKEIKRAERFDEQYPDAKAKFPLIEAKMTKEQAMGMLVDNNIELPAMYKLGYHNNNCLGCPKGGAGYWNKIRNDFPETFKQMAEVERLIKRSCIKGVFLDELDPSRGNYPVELKPECGVYCPAEDFA